MELLRSRYKSPETRANIGFAAVVEADGVSNAAAE
jgi:hypothetical protein